MRFLDDLVVTLGLAKHEQRLEDVRNYPRVSTYFVKEDTEAAKENQVSGILASTITVFKDGRPETFLGDPITEQIRFRDLPGVDLTASHRPKVAWFSTQSISKMVLPFQIK